MKSFKNRNQKNLVFGRKPHYTFVTPHWKVLRHSVPVTKIYCVPLCALLCVVVALTCCVDSYSQVYSEPFWLDQVEEREMKRLQRMAIKCFNCGDDHHLKDCPEVGVCAWRLASAVSYPSLPSPPPSLPPPSPPLPPPSPLPPLPSPLPPLLPPPPPPFLPSPANGCVGDCITEKGVLSDSRHAWH